jgi:NADH:ubiquinone oxidoreductase subunit 6 (subunit J)
VYNELQALLLCGALVATIGYALFSPRVSNSLIALFYSSVILGVVFALYGDSLLGLIQMATFAGAVSVLTLTVILLTGESRVPLGARRSWIVAGGILVAFVAAAFAYFGGFVTAYYEAPYPDISNQVFEFIWQNRPWDLLIMITAFASAMVTITNLLSREP